MMIFSPFFPASGGLVTSAGLAPSFPGVGVAAHNIPKFKEREVEMMRKTRIDLLKFDFIVPPKN
jgi:hypothetical protein